MGGCVDRLISGYMRDVRKRLKRKMYNKKTLTLNNSSKINPSTPIQSTHPLLFNQPIHSYSINPSTPIQSTHPLLFNQPIHSYSINPSTPIQSTHPLLFNQPIHSYSINPSTPIQSTHPLLFNQPIHSYSINPSTPIQSTHPLLFNKPIRFFHPINPSNHPSTTSIIQDGDLSLNTTLANSISASSTSSSAPIDKKDALENGGGDKGGKSNGYDSPRNSRK